jgi:hypothetical protein
LSHNLSKFVSNLQLDGDIAVPRGTTILLQQITSHQTLRPNQSHNKAVKMSEIIIDSDGDLRLQLRDYCSDAFDDDTSAVLAPGLEQVAIKDTTPVDTSTDDMDESTAEESTLSVIVSSELLSAVSPVFKSMLRGKFKEGLELARCKETSTIYTIELPEDDAEAALVFCSVLHGNIDHVPSNITPTLLSDSELATFADKYLCGKILESVGKTWIKDNLEELKFIDTCQLQDCDGREIMEAMEGLRKCLFFAYKVDLAEEYASVGAALVLNISDDGRHNVKDFIDQPEFHHNVVGTSSPPIQTPLLSWTY